MNVSVSAISGQVHHFVTNLVLHYSGVLNKMYITEKYNLPKDLKFSHDSEESYRWSKNWIVHDFWRSANLKLFHSHILTESMYQIILDSQDQCYSTVSSSERDEAYLDIQQVTLHVPSGRWRILGSRVTTVQNTLTRIT